MNFIALKSFALALVLFLFNSHQAKCFPNPRSPHSSSERKSVSLRGFPEEESVSASKSGVLRPSIILKSLNMAQKIRTRPIKAREFPSTPRVPEGDTEDDSKALSSHKVAYSPKIVLKQFTNSIPYLAEPVVESDPRVKPRKALPRE